MFPSARVFARAATRTTARHAATVLPRHAFRQQGRRCYSSEPAKSSSSIWLYVTGAAAAGGLGFWYYTANGAPSAASGHTASKPTKEDYQKVYNEIASRLEENEDYDDGSYGPVLLRLAWHCSGTYDKETGTGGSNGSTMRFSPESDHGANAGLVAARKFLEPVKGALTLSLHLVCGKLEQPLTCYVRREVPLDHLFGSLDSWRRLRRTGDAGAYCSLSTWSY